MRKLRLGLMLGVLLSSLLLISAQEKQKNNLRITHGPILGRPSATGMGVWARTNRPAEFRVRYGVEKGKLNQVSKNVKSDLENDNTGWIHLQGLKPNTTYYYEVQIVGNKDAKTPGGSFRTFPDPKAYVDKKLNPKGLFNFSFEFACGNNQNPGQGGGSALPAFKTMLNHLQGKAIFAIQNGDFLYETEREYKPQQWIKQVGITEREYPRNVQVAPTLVGVWENYKSYLSRGKNLAAWHRNVPSFFTFDDHEILNDVYGCGTAGLRDRRAVFRDIGIEAWYDYIGWSNPTHFTQGIHFGEAKLKAKSDILVDPGAKFTKLKADQRANLHVHWGGPTAGVNDNALDEVGGDPNAGVYDIVKVMDDTHLQIKPAADEDGVVSYSIGRKSYAKFRVSNCDFYLLDTRTHREQHDIENRRKPGLSMLGKDQKAWLKDNMKKSDAEFFFVVSSVNFMIPHLGGGKVRATNKDDAWTVFLDEREELIKFWDGLKRPVFILTGDLHNSFAIKITDRVWEFASGPHNSNNHRIKDEGSRPANGPFDSFGRKCDIRWSTHFLDDIPRDQLQHPTYCVIQINNVYNTPKKVGEERWMAFPKPHVIFQYYNGRTGDLRYAETIRSTK